MNIREEDIPEVREESFRYPRARAADPRVRDHQPGRFDRERLAQPSSG
jgi:hypothetical protein